MSSTMYGPACDCLSQPVDWLTTRAMSLIEVPLVVVCRRLAHQPWGCRLCRQPHTIICIEVGPHQYVRVCAATSLGSRIADRGGYALIGFTADLVALALGCVGVRVGELVGDLVGDLVGLLVGVGIAVLGVDVFRATGTAARASGWFARKSAGSGTPSIWCRSSQTFATERAAMVSSARSAAARVAGLIRASRSSAASGDRSPVFSTVPAERAAIRAAVETRDRTCASVSSVQPAPRQY